MNKFFNSTKKILVNDKENILRNKIEENDKTGLTKNITTGLVNNILYKCKFCMNILISENNININTKFKVSEINLKENLLIFASESFNDHKPNENYYIDLSNNEIKCSKCKEKIGTLKTTSERIYLGIFLYDNIESSGIIKYMIKNKKENQKIEVVSEQLNNRIDYFKKANLEIFNFNEFLNNSKNLDCVEMYEKIKKIKLNFGKLENKLNFDENF